MTINNTRPFVIYPRGLFLVSSISLAVLLVSSSLAHPALAAGAEEAVKLAELADPIIVVGQREGYDTEVTRTATKTDTPLKDVPQAVSVVTAQQIADQSLRSIGEVLHYVPGVQAASGEGHRDQIILRGQNTTADFFVDGIRDDVQYYRGLYNLDRVEVLKGPNAMIFGRGGGGIVNRVTKKANGQSFVAGALSLDTHGAWSAETDFGTPIASGVSGRLNAAYETFDSFRDHVDGHRIGINPTIGWAVGDSTRIDLSYEYSHDRRITDRGIPSQSGRPLNGAQELFFGDPDVNRLRFDAHVGDLGVEHRFGDRLRWTGKLRVGSYHKFYRNALAASAVSASNIVGIEAYQSKAERDSLFVQNDLVAELTTGPVAHTLLVGIDHGREDTFADRQQGYFDSSPTATAGGTRFAVPLSSSDDLPPITFRAGAARPATAADTDATATGIYVQDQARIGEHVEIVAALRRDWFKLRYDDRLSAIDLTRKDALWSPRIGVVIKPNETLSLYGSWSKSFLPQSGDQFSSLSATTASLAPEEFVNREVGAKWSPRPGLDLTLAAYVLDRTNTRATDPATQLTVLTGEQQSKGIEASATGQLTRRLSLAAAAAIQKAEITRTTAAAPEGRDLPSVPKFTGSLWGRYDLTDRIGLGLGVYHQSKIFASISNAVVVPGYTRVDAAAFVGLTKQIALQLNVENLLDKDYVGAVHTDNNLTPGGPRAARVTLRAKF